MEIITSKNNKKIEFAIKLKQKKFRNQFNKVLLEGAKIILEAQKSGLKIETLFVDNIDRQNGIIASEVFVIDKKLCEKLSSTVNSQNVFAIVSTEKQNNSKICENIIILDNLQNPDNLGAIIRTAVATNFTTILSINSVDLYNEKTIRSSMGNLFKINFIETDYQLIKSLISGYSVLCLDMNGENIFKVNSYDKKVAVIVGNEGNGVSEEMKNLATKTLSIPMENNVESLNASVSIGIALYQIYKVKGE